MGNFLSDLPVTIATWIIPTVISGVIDTAEPLIKAQLGGATRIVSEELSALTPAPTTLFDLFTPIAFAVISVLTTLRGIVEAKVFSTVLHAVGGGFRAAESCWNLEELATSYSMLSTNYWTALGKSPPLRVSLDSVANGNLYRIARFAQQNNCCF
ncbi:hypothetical protein FHG87_007445 [Trinorchestia longiramus]|nr:hypothetical protein FHG87_007445 [Trinorchestia longiramus]